MPEVAITFRVPGAAQTLQTLDQVRGRVAAVAKTSSASLTDVRQTTQQLSSALHSLSGILRLTGQGNSEFAQQLDKVAIVLFTVTTVTQSLRAVMGTMPAVLRAVQLAMQAMAAQSALLLASWGPIILAAAALAVGIYLIVKATRDHNAATKEATQRTIELNVHLATQSARYAEMSKDADKAAGAMRGVVPESVRAEQARRIDAIAAAGKKLAEDQKKATEEAEAARKRALEAESDSIVAFNEWQRQQWETAAAARTAAFIKSTDAIIADQQRLAKETEDLINESNRQTIEAIEREERERTEAGQRILEEAEQANVRLRNSVQQTLEGVLTGTATFADLWTSIWLEAVKRIIEQLGLVDQAVSLLQNLLPGLFGGGGGGGGGGLFGGGSGNILNWLPFFFFQRGGSFTTTRPQLIGVGETAERVTVEPLAGAPARGGGEVHVHLTNVVADNIAFAKFVRHIRRSLVMSPMTRLG